MRLVPVLATVVALLANAPAADAAYQLPLSVKHGCREGRWFIKKNARESVYVNDWTIDTCYARSRYTVAVEYTVYGDASYCFRRGLVTFWSDGYFRWKSYALSCS